MQNQDFTYIESFIDYNDSLNYFNILKSEIKWRQDQFKIFGKVINVPRLTAWYGDRGMRYSYSGLNLVADGWHPLLESIKLKVESQFSVKFNSVLVNYYRNNQDSMGWHSDDEKELGINPNVAILSFGETRKLQFKPKKDENLNPFYINLDNGSLLLMVGKSQHDWLHQIPKSKREIGERISLTYRKIID